MALRSKEGSEHGAQEVRMWHCYHTLVDLWAWTPDEEVRFGRGTYTVQVGDAGAHLLALRMTGGELCEFVWRPAANTLVPLGRGVDDMLALFVTPPRLA